MWRRPLHGSAAGSLRGDGLWHSPGKFLSPWLKWPFCFLFFCFCFIFFFPLLVSGLASLEQGGRAASEPQSRRPEEGEGEGDVQVNGRAGREAINTRLTSSIEG